MYRMTFSPLYGRLKLRLNLGRSAVLPGGPFGRSQHRTGAVRWSGSTPTAHGEDGLLEPVLQKVRSCISVNVVTCVDSVSVPARPQAATPSYIVSRAPKAHIRGYFGHLMRGKAHHTPWKMVRQVHDRLLSIFRYPGREGSTCPLAARHERFLVLPHPSEFSCNRWRS